MPHKYQLLCSRIPAIFYDLDGTLADTEWHLYEIWVEMMAAYGRVFTLEDYLGVIGTPEDEKVPEVLKTFGIAEDPKAFYGRFQGFLKARLLAGLKPMPGAEESLKKSHATGAPIGLVTSATAWHAEHALETLGFKGYFYPGTRVTAETPGLTRRKPHPEPYLLAAKLMHVRPGGCVVFEDSVQGAKAARMAGMLVVGVPHRLSPREKLEEVAHYVIPEGKTIADFAFTDIRNIDIMLPRGSR
ncbi:MAG TPA: HAD family phosphatase [Candidatus Baltobacteraceae bacterium]|nr:HAD family phosphatase [Candidatus Baltobacteraceae bacterium]